MIALKSRLLVAIHPTPFGSRFLASLTETGIVLENQENLCWTLIAQLSSSDLTEMASNWSLTNFDLKKTASVESLKNSGLRRTALIGRSTNFDLETTASEANSGNSDLYSDMRRGSNIRSK